MEKKFNMPILEEPESPGVIMENVVINIFLDSVKVLQAYGFILTFSIMIIAYFIRHIAKQRKNMIVQSKAYYTFLGMCFLTIVFGVVPYLGFYMLEGMDNAFDDSEHWIVPVLDVLQSYSVWIAILVVVSSTINYYIAQIRRNHKMKGNSRALIIGAILICIFFHIVPDIMLTIFYKEGL